MVFCLAKNKLTMFGAHCPVNPLPQLAESKVLSNFIDVAYELGLLAEDVKKFSHTLRDFRNYIHPYQQMSSRFNPDKHTAKISWQVLKAALFQLSKNKLSSGTA